MLGEKIREYRISKGMSMKDLAQETGLTSGFISQVERNLTEPSITSLRKLSDALEVAMFKFFIEEDENKTVVRKNNRKKIKFAMSHATYELLSPTLNRQMEMLLGKLNPGAKTSAQPMSHDGEEVIYVISGKMHIQVGEEHYDLDAGDAIYYQGTIPHLITNKGDEVLEFVSTITPPRF